MRRVVSTCVKPYRMCSRVAIVSESDGFHKALAMSSLLTFTTLQVIFILFLLSVTTEYFKEVSIYVFGYSI
jgi:hypothetical protein